MAETKEVLRGADLEKHFEPFRKNIIGIDQTLEGPYGEEAAS